LRFFAAINTHLSLSQIVAVILAGGLGTRIRHLLPGLPKPMAPVAGRPFLEWMVRYLARQGIADVVLSTGYRGEVVAEHFARQPVPGVATCCVAETEPLGTAGGFLNAVRACGKTPAAWLVLNGDSLVFADLAATARMIEEPGTRASDRSDRSENPNLRHPQAKDLLNGAASGVIIGREVPDASRFGTLVIGPGGALRGFQEKRPGRGVISAGVYLLRAALVAAFPDRLPLSFETDVFPELTAREASLKVQVVNAPFLDIGTPETLSQAETFIEGNRAQFLAGDER
jgi:NDP-sugar pyrophosphorylase family protein